MLATLPRAQRKPLRPRKAALRRDRPLCYDAAHLTLEAPLFILLSIAALVVALVAIRRTRADGVLARRIETLEEEVRALRQRLERGAPQAAPPLEPELAPVLPADEMPPEPAAVTETTPAAAEVGAPAAAEGGPMPPLLSTSTELFPRIDWERLFGVRAAAVLGGVALALAGLLFFKYSIEHGLIPPWLRVVLGTIVGVGCVAASEWWMRRDYAGTANALAGAGLVVLYAAFWAASALFGLVPLAVGFVLMIAVTAACCTLADRHRSPLIAGLGLLGGFATPLLLSSGSDRPFGLFGYVLLLDVALLLLAQRRRWPALALVSLAGTVFYEALWIGERMGPERLGLGLGILGLFALVFTVAGRGVAEEQRAQWRITQAAGVLVPFAFVFYFAADADFGPQLHGVAMLLVLLAAAASWLARRRGPPVLAFGAAAACLAVVAVWATMRSFPDALAWELALWSVALALTFHLFVEREPARADRDGPAPPAILAAAGFFVLLIVAAVEGDSLWPWILGWAALAALLIRHGGFAGRESLHLAAALGLALGLAHLREAQQQAPWFPDLASYLGLLVATALALQIVAFLPRARPAATRFAEHAAALLPVMLLLSLTTGSAAPQAPLPWLGGALLLGVLAAFAATRLDLGAWLLAAVGATALVHHQWSSVQAIAAAHPFAAEGAGAAAVAPGIALQALAVVIFTAWPFLALPRFRADRLAWPAAALAAPCWFWSLKLLYELRYGSDWIGLLPLALGAVSAVALARARHVWRPEELLRVEGIAGFAVAALGFATVAIPLQLAREWITIGWALEGFAVLVLWTRLDHPALKYFGVALLAAATVRLVANPAVLGYYPRPAWRIVNWLLYTYLVPAVALLTASGILARHELAHARRWEAALYAQGRAWGAQGTGLAGLLVIFVWINLAIADWFASGEALVISFARLPARDLTTSIAWALYALVLLTLGVVRRSIGLRWASLALLLLTIAKVFLHDLGELRDLYRVASLLGLAISLIAVSLAYQRFVFREAGKT